MRGLHYLFCNAMRITRTRTAQAPISKVLPTGLRVLGIDPSLTSTGYAYRDPEGNIKTGHVSPDGLRGPWRLSYIRRKLEGILSLCEPTLVAYEDYAMGFGGQKGSPGRVFHLGELGGVLKTMLWERGIDVLIVPNTVLKKVIIGKAGGNVKKAVTKEDMVSALAGYGYRVAQFDEADATGLMLCGEWKTDATQIPKNARQSNRFGSLSQCETVRGKLQSIAKS